MATPMIDRVREQYAVAAASNISTAHDGARFVAEAFGYTPDELAALPAEANLGLSCGNPTAFANLRLGEIVVDLGCGGGMDVLLAAVKVGPTGKAIGIDMTAEMLDRARRNARRPVAGQILTNIEFHLATIDRLPLADASVDCLISNCVINLAPDKRAVFREMWRVLKPGARVALSDIALKRPLPDELARNVAAYVGCIAGAIALADYECWLREAGFPVVQVVDTKKDLNAYASIENQAACCSPGSDQGPCCGSATTPVHQGLADLLLKYNVNDYAASVQVYARKRSEFFLRERQDQESHPCAKSSPIWPEFWSRGGIAFTARWSKPAVPPRKAGAAMLVFADGSQRGTLGGGCVEGEVKQRALRTLMEGGGAAEVLTFNLDDNYGWDDGLICGGRMSILADPLTAGAVGGRREAIATYFRQYRGLVESGKGCTEAIVLAEREPELHVGQRYLFDSTGQPVAQLASGMAAAVVMAGLPPVRQRPKPVVRDSIAYLPIWPRITLLIVGGGHVGQAVAKLAAEVDFDIWVVDDRAHYASPERFPAAQRLLVGDVGSTLQQLAKTEITESTFCLIVTRGHGHDEEALYHLAEAPAGYVGMIGSKRKIKLIFEDLLARNISAASLGRVHAPLGFAIGSQTVPEIAISIVAELIACRNLGATISAARKHVPV